MYVLVAKRQQVLHVNALGRAPTCVKASCRGPLVNPFSTRPVGMYADVDVQGLPNPSVPALPTLTRPSPSSIVVEYVIFS